MSSVKRQNKLNKKKLIRRINDQLGLSTIHVTVNSDRYYSAMIMRIFIWSEVWLIDQQQIRQHLWNVAHYWRFCFYFCSIVKIRFPGFTRISSKYLHVTAYFERKVVNLNSKHYSPEKKWKKGIIIVLVNYCNSIANGYLSHYSSLLSWL